MREIKTINASIFAGYLVLFRIGGYPVENE